MSIMNIGSRVTYAQLKAHLRGIALAHQQWQTKTGDSFLSLSTTDYTDNTLLRGLQKAIDGATTGLAGWSSVSGWQQVAPVLNALRRNLTDGFAAGTTAAMLAAGYAQYIVALMTAFSTAHDTEHDNFWDAYGALWTEDEWFPGECADILAAAGHRTDPQYTHPPTGMWLSNITFTGAAAATLTTKGVIDPNRYQNHVTEWYVTARAGAPDEISMTVAGGKSEADTPTDKGATDFTLVVAIGDIAGATGDVAQTDDKQLCSTEDASLTITGGKSGDIVELRIKAPFAMAFPT